MEVLSEGGGLLYQRILLHTHSGDQLFLQSRASVNIDSETVVIVWAHMNRAGYGELTLRGQPNGGFRRVALLTNFAVYLCIVVPGRNIPYEHGSTSSLCAVSGVRSVLTRIAETTPGFVPGTPPASWGAQGEERGESSQGIAQIRLPCSAV